MATDPQELIRRRQVMPLTGMGQPVGLPTPLPMLSASMAAPANPPPIAAEAAPPVAPAATAAPNDPTMMRAVTAPFRAIGNAVANVYDTDEYGRPRRMGQPAAAPAQAQVRAVDNAVAAVPAGMGQPVGPATPAPVPGAVAPAVANLPGAEGTQPTNASEGAMSPVAATTAAATAPAAGAAPALGSLEDTNARLGRLQASNAAVPRGGMSVIANPGPEAAQAMFDGAALRTAAGQGSWSPRRGYQGNDDAVRAASIPVANRARMGEAQLNADTSLTNTAVREAGDTARLGMRTTADAAQATATGQREQQRLDMEKEINQLRGTGLGMDNASKARIEAVQNEIASAKTPEARRTATEKLAALTGKTPQDQFAALELGGGSAVDASGMVVPQPKSAIVYNKATGQYQQVGAAPAAPAAKAPAEGSMSTSNGKPIKFVGGKWVPA